MSASETPGEFTVVIPTIGRPSLATTLAALGADVTVVVVDDRPPTAVGELPGAGSDRVRVVRSGGRGPAAARNAGWRAAGTPWVVFLDDDVVPAPGWARAVTADLTGLPEEAAGSQGRVEVPLPQGRAPTDDERNTAGLAGAAWITADMAYRRAALEKVNGFDERFPRAYREDADLALRLRTAGWLLVRGERLVRHPVRDDGPWASLRRQRGNADDALMRRVHGPGWRAAVGEGGGRLGRHALTTGLGLVGLLAGALALGSDGRAARALRGGAALAGAGWLALTAEFAWARIAPGPRTGEEIRRMTVTSVLIPPAACAHRLRGEWRVRR
ncbi:glycosyltransferase family 2 protein [Streptosporangium sp. NPDC049376]|uniref:glycosyltransferase family 2 protein n=1 Tax=Streptosporangium sp. NPDC049376 TaxID=3366192 RepID=UPI00378D0104